MLKQPDEALALPQSVFFGALRGWTIHPKSKSDGWSQWEVAC